MAVANTQYSTNSYRVIVTNELDSNTIIAGVNTAITTLGWSLYDTVAQTEYSPMATYVYRVLNADSTTYKYAILRWNTLLLNFNLSTCEDWNTTTNVPTNESWHNAGMFYQGYDIKDCTIFVGATSRHLIIQPFIRNEPGLWSAIFEFERVAAEDISQNSAPCFAYTNSLMLGTPWGQTSNNTPSRFMFAFPRTADNQTGAYAARVYAPVTTRGMYPPYYPSANTGNTGANSVIIVGTHDGNALHLGSFYNTLGTWGWDPGKAVVSPITVDHIYKSMPFGRIYNAGITKPVGSQSLDSTYINADSTGGWPTSTGSNTEFLSFALNGGSETEYANTLGRLSVSWSNNNSIVYGSVLAIGNTVWAAANNGVWTWDMNAGANTSAIQRVVNSNGIVDIMFDGLRSVYGTTNNGIIQIDTETYATNANTGASDLGCAAINMDQKYIYCSNRTRNTGPKIYIFARANNNLMKQMNVGALLAAASGFGKPTPDYKGFVYSAVQQGAQTTGSGNVRLIVWNSEAANANVGATNTVYTISGTVNWQHTFYYEYVNDRLFLFVNQAGTGAFIEYANVPNTNLWTQIFSTSTNAWAPASVQGNYTYNPSPAITGTFDNLGDLVFMPHRGYMHITPRRTGAPQTAQTAYSLLMSIDHPDGPNGIGKPFSFGNMQTGDVITSAANGFPTHQWTNGVRVFQTLWRSNTEARIITLGNLYPNTQFNTYQTGRLLIKA
jgi:hypothetical protein